MVRNGTPHGTAPGPQRVLVTHDDTLLLRPRYGYVDTAGIEHEPAELVADAAASNSGDDHHVRVRSLAGVHLPVDFNGGEEM